MYLHRHKDFYKVACSGESFFLQMTPHRSFIASRLARFEELFVQQLKLASYLCARVGSGHQTMPGPRYYTIRKSGKDQTLRTVPPTLLDHVRRARPAVVSFPNPHQPLAGGARSLGTRLVRLAAQPGPPSALMPLLSAVCVPST